MISKDDEIYYSDELYEYYKKWLNTAIAAYRNSDEGRAKQTWLKLSHRASCLTDIWLRLHKEYTRKYHGG